MIPILAGYIASAIGDRAALAPGMIGGWIANNGSFIIPLPVPVLSDNNSRTFSRILCKVVKTF